MTPETPSIPNQRSYPPWLDGLDKRRYWLFAGIVLLYLVGFTGVLHLGSDAARYAELGRNIAEGKGYTYHGQHERLLFPGLPYLHAIARVISPTHHGLISHGVLLAMGLGLIALTYQLLLAYAPRPVALLGLMLTAMLYGVYEYSFNLMTDMPYSLGVIATFLGYTWLLEPKAAGASSGRAVMRWRSIAAWLALVLGVALAISMRPTMLALVITMLLCGVFHLIRGPYRIRAMFVLLAVSLVTAVFYVIDPRRASTGDLHYEAALADRAADPFGTIERIFTEMLPPLYNYVFAEAIFAVDFSMPANLLPTLLALLFLVVGCWRRWAWALFILINLGGMLLLSANVPRYLLPMTPVFMLGAAIAYCRVRCRFPRCWGLHLSNVLFIVLVAPNVAKMGKLVWVQHQDPFFATFKDGKFLPRIDAGQAISEHVSPDETVIASNYRELTYLTGQTVVNLKSLESPRVASVVIDRWENHSKQFYLIEQDNGIPVPDTFLDFEMTLGPVIAQSPPGAQGSDYWRLREVTLTRQPAAQGGGP